MTKTTEGQERSNEILQLENYLIGERERDREREAISFPSTTCGDRASIYLSRGLVCVSSGEAVPFNRNL